MRRRSLLAMIGLAPAAAAVGPTPVMEAVKTGRIAQGGYASAGLNAAADTFFAGEEIKAMDRAERLAKNVIERRARLAAYRFRRANGLLKTENIHSEDPNIESRKATSPAIKAILQHEYYLKKHEEELESEYRRATKMATLLVPEWLQDWV